MKVSVAVCTYQGAAHLAEQLESIAGQMRRPDEVVLSDDGSKDNTLAIARRILSAAGIPHKICVNRSNLGIRRNFEQAIRKSTGDIIVLSDQDDVWLPQKIERLIQAFESAADAVLVFHDAAVVDEALAPLAPSFWKVLRFDVHRFLQRDYRRLWWGNVVQGSACAFRRALLTRALPLSTAAYHDEWLAWAAAASGRILPLGEVLSKYRQSEANLIGAGQLSLKSRLAAWRKLKARGAFHFGELMRREAAAAEALRRFKSQAAAGFAADYGEAVHAFLLWRKQRIKQGTFYLLPHYLRYQREYKALQGEGWHPLKEYGKDLAASLVIKKIAADKRD